MRDSQLQTPQRAPSYANRDRRPKSTPDVKGNLIKVVRKSLIPELTNVLEESPKKVSDHDPFTGFDENLIAPVNSVIVHSSGTSVISELVSPSSTITSDENVNVNEFEVDHFKIESIEVEMVVKCLKEARVRVLESEGLGYSKKLLDALISVITEEYSNTVCGEKEWLDKLLSSKANLFFLIIMLVIIVVWFFYLGSEDSLMGLPPT